VKKNIYLCRNIFAMIGFIKKYSPRFGLINALALINSGFLLDRLSPILYCTRARAVHIIKQFSNKFSIFFVPFWLFFCYQKKQPTGFFTLTMNFGARIANPRERWRTEAHGLQKRASRRKQESTLAEREFFATKTNAKILNISVLLKTIMPMEQKRKNL